MHIGVDAGVVDEDVATTVFLLVGFTRAAPVFLLADITVNGNGLASGLRNQLAGF